MRATPLSVCLTTVFAIGLSSARADFVIYRLPSNNVDLTFVLQGRVTPLGRTVELSHAKFGKLVFSRQSVEIFEMESVPKRLDRPMMKAYNEENAELLLHYGQTAMRQGYIKTLHNAASAVLEFEPDNERAKLIMQAKVDGDNSVSGFEQAEKEIRQVVRLPQMRIAKSKHFIVLHDLNEDDPDRDGKGIIDDRLELMETVYAGFFSFFASRGVKLDRPTAPLKVVLFNEHRDYFNYATGRSPSLKQADGFWVPKLNVSFFYEHKSSADIQQIQEVSDQVGALAKEALRLRTPNRAELIRFAKSLDVVIKIERDNEDITVLTHELTHQLAGSTNLLPRDVPIPTWVHEGLATYFEAPKDATWSGIGAVNDDRLEWYRGLESDREHSNIGFIASDRVFGYAETLGSLLHGYGQSWALTHFLMERHFDELMKYYRLLGALPAGEEISHEEYERVFNEAFAPGEERIHLDVEWRNYMDSLKTDIEIAIGKRVPLRSTGLGSGTANGATYRSRRPMPANGSTGQTAGRGPMPMGGAAAGPHPPNPPTEPAGAGPGGRPGQPAQPPAPPPATSPPATKSRRGI